MLFETFIESPLGRLRLLASPRGLSAILMPEHRPGKVDLGGKEIEGKPTRELLRAKAQLDEYFAGDRRTFDLPLDPLGGTAFQRKVWESLLLIPYGATTSYSAQAEGLLGARSAARAVALANSKNPLSIIVPCHRVVAADGNLRGYAGGIPAKIYLLELEARFAKSPPGRDRETSAASPPLLQAVARLNS